MPPVGPGPGGGTVRVTPADIGTAAKNFAAAQDSLSTAWDTLLSSLDSNAGFAGDDDPAKAFDAKYEPAVQAAWKALRSATLTLGGISLGLTQTASNFLAADHHSSATKHGAQPALAPEPVISNLLMPGPSSAIGPGETVWFLPGPLAKFWPNAHTGKARAAANAWHNAAAAVGSVTEVAQSALLALEADDDTTKAINGFWSQVYSPGNDKTVLAGTQHLCQALGDACARYADAIDSKRSDVQGKLIGAGIAVGVTTIIGIAASIFTGGGSDVAAGGADEAEVAAIVGDVAADTAATVDADVGAAIAEDLVATVEAAADDAPAVETAGAETIDVQGDIEDSLDKALADSAGEGSLSPQQLQEAYDYANTEPKLAHIIDPAKHGFADLVQATGGRSQAMKLIVDSLGAGQDLPESGPFAVTRMIDGAQVTIRGAMVNGIPKIGTAFIADAFPGAGA
jgi:hypothetical protein